LRRRASRAAWGPEWPQAMVATWCLLRTTGTLCVTERLSQSGCDGRETVCGLEFDRVSQGSGPFCIPFKRKESIFALKTLKAKDF